MKLKIALQPKQAAFAESIKKNPVTFFGGAKGGGKSAGLRKIFLLRRFDYPGSTGAIFRKTYPELEANHIRPIFEEYPELRPYYNESKKTLTLPNGSSLQFCHAGSEKDLDLYQGREYNDLGIEEAGQWTETMFRRLMGSNRSSKSGIPSRAALTGNPGGIGHKWLKRLFIERRFNERERPEDYAFIQALVRDNAALLDNDPDYVRRLEAEPSETLRKAYLYGDWDIFAGQFFSEIRREVHFIDPLPIQPHWNRFGAYDYGYNHPAIAGWFASDEDGNVYLYRELAKAQVRVDQFATKMLTYPETKDMTFHAGLDCWTTRNVLKDEGTPATIAAEFLEHGIHLKRATVDRIQGAAQLRKFLAWQNLPEGAKGPRLFIFKTCPVTFDALTRVEHDPDRVEDVLKIDAVDGDPMTGDDAYDMIRYGMMSRPTVSDALKPKLITGSRAWYEKQAEDIWEREREQLEKAQGGNAWESDADISWPTL